VQRSLTFIVIGMVLAVGACADQAGNPVSPAHVSPLSVSGDSPEAARAAPSAEHQYRITIENLTTGQPFSPGVLVTHTKEVALFRVGQRASEGIRLIAEDGDQTLAAATLASQPGVHQLVELTSPIHRVGGPGPTSATLEISAAANANRVSLATMLICTNDGFTGLDSIKLPGGFTAETHLTAGYDAGTEANNEQFSQIVDPCQLIGPPVPGPPVPNGNGRVATTGVILHHPNIQGGGNLVIAQHGWQDPVARITILRLK
jgi:Spondin_N